MISVLFQALLLASSGLLAFGSMTLVIILLMSADNGLSRALGYFLGYYMSYTIIGIFIVIIGAQVAVSTLTQVRTFFSVVFIILGLVLLYVGFRNLNRPKRENGGENRFIRLMRNVSPKKAFGLGMTVTIINFKNLSLFLAAISVVALSRLVILTKLVIAILVAIVFCLSVAFPILVYLLFPVQRDVILRRIRQFLNDHGREISIIVPIIFGLILMVKGVVDLP